MKRNIRSAVRLFFLFLIFTLWIFNRIELWMFTLLAGILLVPFLGRIYCGWICPVFTAIDLFQPIMKKPKLQKYIKYLQSRVLKLTLFIVFLLIFLVIKIYNFSLPFFILLIPIGILLSVLFGPSQWHRICPFGIIFSLPARFSRRSYNLLSQNCSKCGRCVRECENDCLTFGGNKTLNIEKEHCLSCGKCKEVCHQNNISYGQIMTTTKGGATL